MGGYGAFPALSIEQPKDPLTQVAQVMGIRQAAQQQELGGLQIQEEQQRIADQHALTTAMASWDGKNYTDIPALVTKAGGSGAARMAATNSILDIRAKASDIAKSDAITNSNNVETQAKLNDQYRGRVLNIIGIGDDAKRQAAWDAEVTREEQAGTIQPGAFSHTYPGDAVAMTLANNFALGSQIVKEMDDRQRLALDAWKPSQGKLVNVITNESIGGLKPADIDTYNAALKARWQVLNPGKDVPDYFQLKSGASPVDLDRVDKALEQTEKATGTKAQLEQANAIRQQTFEMARDKADMKAVVGTDPKSGQTVLVPFAQAQKMGITDAMQASDDQTNKALAARHWLQLANKQAPAGSDPSDMGISQLISKLDADGKLGVVASRWNDFMAGKVGAGDPYVEALRAKMGLSTTLLMQAHTGNRGGAAILEHFQDLADQKKLDGPTLKSAFNSEVNYVTDRAMDPNPPSWNTPAKSTISPAAKGQASGPPAGATMKVPGSDGKMHWSDGKRDLGVAE